jgi:transposase-like protein
MPKRRVWQCRECKRQFSAKVGTIFEDSPIGFRKWLPAMWLLASAKNGISSYELGKALGVTQKTAWFMLHRIRLTMQNDDVRPMGGEVEADESFIGGKLRHKRRTHYHVASGMKPVGPVGKTPVMGILQREGQLRAFTVPDVRKRTLVPRIFEHVERGATLYTDYLRSYRHLDSDFVHRIVNHAIEYVSRDGAHINNLECFWNLLKRTLGGTYTHVNPRHLDRYLDEQIFRWNERERTDGQRFPIALKGADGKRLTYKGLTRKPD